MEQKIARPDLEKLWRLTRLLPRELQKNNGKPDKGLNRLFRILISESMFHDIVLSHLVFHIMYKDPTKTHSAHEIHNEWLQAINSRPKIHCKNCGD